MTKRSGILVAVLCAVAAIFFYERSTRPAAAGILGMARDGSGATKVSFLSENYRIDRIFQSMQGPHSALRSVTLGSQSASELLWITSVGAEVVDRTGQANLSEEFFCHANLSLDSIENRLEEHNELLGTSVDWRLFTLVPGRMRINLPEGFGIPVSSTEKFDFFSMSLNLNEPKPNFDLRFKSHISYMPEQQLPGKMKPLFMRGLYVVVPLLKGTNGLPEAICAVPGSTTLNGRLSSQGMSCAPPSMTASAGGVRGTNTLHWMAPPGRHTYSCDVTEQMNLGFDTTLHYATGHMHPFGETLTLIDKTTGEPVVEIRSKDYAGRKGVQHMDELSFSEGVAVYREHQYELVTTYNNPTDQPTDVMAIFYAYLFDKRFDRKKVSFKTIQTTKAERPKDGRM